MRVLTVYIGPCCYHLYKSVVVHSLSLIRFKLNFYSRHTLCGRDSSTTLVPSNMEAVCESVHNISLKGDVTVCMHEFDEFFVPAST